MRPLAVTRARPVLSLDAPDDSLELPAADPDPAEALLRAETRAAVWVALGQLAPDQRAAVVLRYYLDLSEPEIAAFQAVPAGTVKWRLHAARRRLRRLLKTRQDVPPHSDGRARNSKGEPDGR